MPLSDVSRPGFGTFKLTGDQCAEMVETALDIGYRHVDTAQYYENEAAVGRGIAASDVPRDELRVASKVWHDSLAYDDVVDAVHESRDRLGLDFIDRYYVHWPANTYDPNATLGALADLKQDGVIDEIGVSNFTVDCLDEAREACTEPIQANQIEVHPGFPQEPLVNACDTRDVEVVAYSPFGHGIVLGDDTIYEIADRYVVSPARIVVAYLLAKGVTPIPKAGSWAHAVDNWRAQDLALTDDEIAAIDAIDGYGRLGDPPFAPW